MPSLQKHHVNVARHLKLMDKNICANVIRHEYVVTGRTKAKRAQAKLERLIGKALHQNKLAEGSVSERVNTVAALRYLQPPDKVEIGSKVLTELANRYTTRQHGFTRIIKLEPRLGEDKAPMSVLELVDSEFEVKFWYTAKIVARLELQGLAVDDLTQINVNKLTQHRADGEAKFREAVETCKVRFFDYDPERGEVTSDAARQNLANLPRNLDLHGGKLSGTLVASKKFPTKPRPAAGDAVVLPPSPFLQ